MLTTKEIKDHFDNKIQEYEKKIKTDLTEFDKIIMRESFLYGYEYAIQCLKGDI